MNRREILKGAGGLLAGLCGAATLAGRVGAAKMVKVPQKGVVAVSPTDIVPVVPSREMAVDPHCRVEITDDWYHKTYDEYNQVIRVVVDVRATSDILVAHVLYVNLVERTAGVWQGSEVADGTRTVCGVALNAAQRGDTARVVIFGECEAQMCYPGIKEAQA